MIYVQDGSEEGMTIFTDQGIEILKGVPRRRPHLGRRHATVPPGFPMRSGNDQASWRTRRILISEVLAEWITSSGVLKAGLTTRRLLEALPAEMLASARE